MDAPWVVHCWSRCHRCDARRRGAPANPAGGTDDGRRRRPTRAVRRRRRWQDERHHGVRQDGPGPPPVIELTPGRNYLIDPNILDLYPGTVLKGQNGGGYPTVDTDDKAMVSRITIRTAGKFDATTDAGWDTGKPAYWGVRGGTKCIIRDVQVVPQNLAAISYYAAGYPKATGAATVGILAGDACQLVGVVSQGFRVGVARRQGRPPRPLLRLDVRPRASTSRARTGGCVTAWRRSAVPQASGGRELLAVPGRAERVERPVRHRHLSREHHQGVPSTATDGQGSTSPTEGGAGRHRQLLLPQRRRWKRHHRSMELGQARERRLRRRPPPPSPATSRSTPSAASPSQGTPTAPAGTTPRVVSWPCRTSTRRSRPTTPAGTWFARQTPGSRATASAKRSRGRVRRGRRCGRRRQ